MTVLYLLMDQSLISSELACCPEAAPIFSGIGKLRASARVLA